MAISADIDVSQLERFNKALNRNLTEKVLMAAAKTALDEAGKSIVKIIKVNIARGRVPPENADLTIALKKSGIPLVHTGKLLESVYWKRTSAKKNPAITIGVPNTKKNRAVVGGESFRVTREMRALFFILWQVSIGKMEASKLRGRAAKLWRMYPQRNWKRLSRTTSVINVPKRDILGPIVASPATKRIVTINVNRHIQKVFNRVVKEAGK